MKLNKLPFNKDNLNTSLSYMKQGGNQLIEILEKDVSYEWILNNYDEIGITKRNMEIFKCWCENECIVGRVQKIFGYSDSSAAKSFMYRGAGILNKLLKTVVDFRPWIIDGKIVPKFSFMKYEIFHYEEGIETVIVTPNEENWLDKNINGKWNNFIKIYFIKDGKFFLDNNKVEEIKNAMSTMKKLSL